MRRLFRKKTAKTPAVPKQTSGELEDLTREYGALYQKVRPYTMTGLPRIAALAEAVRYVVKRQLPGAFAECGVWRGGSVLAMITVLQELGCDDRDIYLYDTFEGMTEPTAEDTSRFDGSANETWKQAQVTGERPWGALFSAERFGEEQVRQMLEASGYPKHRLHLVRGPVESTIPAVAPEQIALLRLDTDWYESTRHELLHLYPRLCASGVLIIDDYGHWEGCRRAVDEYFGPGGAAPLLLQRIDYTGRLAIKC
ncbi:MAG TPA: TylF/MycF/NovP-related O-methyltransferase [Nevskiaceae bacterium]|nr:TylF/MycF/NovP-related O-methyltransferase [Nevskiaceae bacterium]